MSLALAYRLRSNGYLMIFLSIGRFDFNLAHLSFKMDQNAKSFETHSNVEKMLLLKSVQIPFTKPAVVSFPTTLVPEYL